MKKKATAGRKSDSSRFHRARIDHTLEAAEDYTEAILDEIESDGRAQLTEIAVRLGVTHPTVAKALKRLARLGYVVIEPYRAISLTSAGKKLAMQSRRRHHIVVNFLLVLGVDARTAEHDAEGIEHHVSKKTLQAMEKILKNQKTFGPSFTYQCGRYHAVNKMFWYAGK